MAVNLKLPVGRARRAAYKSKPETPRSHWYFRVKFSHWHSWGSKRPPRRNLSSARLTYPNSGESPALSLAVLRPCCQLDLRINHVAQCLIQPAPMACPVPVQMRQERAESGSRRVCACVRLARGRGGGGGGGGARSGMAEKR